MSGTGYPGWEQDRPEPGDQVQFGAARRRPWLLRLAAAALVLAAVVVVAVRAASSGHGGHAAARPSTVITNIGHPILGETTGWDLFARGDGFLADIRPGSGRVTRTVVPLLGSANPDVSLVTAPHDVIVRSYDFEPGYLIPDGQSPRQLTGVLAAGGPLLPGPAPDEVWSQAGANQDLHLVTVSGHRIGPVIRVPQGGPPLSVIADGRGYLLGTTISGKSLDLGPSWDRPVHGGVTAIGPTGWLAEQCTGGHRCRYVVIDPATGAQRPLPGAAPPGQLKYWSWAPGVIAPDGTLAAVLDTQSNAAAGLRLVFVDLATGAQTPAGVAFDGPPPPESMVWSPDCRWLFVAWEGRLLAVSAASGKVTTLHLGLPPVSQLAVRSAAT